MEPVLDRLLLSDLSEANDPLFLKMYEVQAILYFGEGGYFPEDIQLYHRPSNGGGGLDREQLRDGIDFLHECLRAGRRVLAVGPTGATIAAAYLAEIGFNHDRALKMVMGGSATRRPDAGILALHTAEMQRRAAFCRQSGAVC